MKAAIAAPTRAVAKVLDYGRKRAEELVSIGETAAAKTKQVQTLRMNSFYPSGGPALHWWQNSRCLDIEPCHTHLFSTSALICSILGSKF